MAQRAAWAIAAVIAAGVAWAATPEAPPVPELRAGIVAWQPTRFEPDPPPYVEETGPYQHAYIWHHVGAPSP